MTTVTGTTETRVASEDASPLLPQNLERLKNPGRRVVLLADGHRPGLWACEGPQMVVDLTIHRTLSS